MRFKMIHLLVLIVGSVTVLSGCQSSKPQETVILQVSYPSAQKFYRDYGYGFEKKYPNIQIQVIPYDWEAANPSQDADIQYMQQLSQYRQEIEQGHLLSLASRFQQDKDQDLTKVSPIMTTLLKSAADNGELYGVSPTFSGEALFYNKDLFSQFGITPPHSEMGWKDIFALASRFPKQNKDGKALYGFQKNYSQQAELQYLLEAGRIEGLSYIQPQTLKVTINTDEWKRILNYTLEAFRSKALYGEDDAGYPLFLTGQAAMTLGTLTSAYSYEEFAKMEGTEPINWGLVTPPINPEQPDRSRYYSVNEVFGISSASPHPEEAWKLLKYMITDSENTRLMANYKHREIPLITEYIQPIAGKDDLASLYTLQAIPNDPSPYVSINQEILNAFQEAAGPILDQVIRGEKSIDNALTEIEIKGQQAVDEAKAALQTKD
ncbi:extracellular solute-binding protein [Cohnella abietis]|uniref:Sugar ABC transporter substrate-binding protein n=1 Tax=Cohnella abietis TaxID=2507935 RepID=A0A3T1D0N2_9BACL|nr:extracellular solute-binding protein [Cohnella abietis]BBI31663.1 sugar ABC transporter substrate-binding protein [Cohnella abietis]